MDRAEAYELASRELGLIESSGYGAAAEHIDTAAQKVVSTHMTLRFPITGKRPGMNTFWLSARLLLKAGLFMKSWKSQ